MVKHHGKEVGYLHIIKLQQTLLIQFFMKIFLTLFEMEAHQILVLALVIVLQKNLGMVAII